MAKAALLKTNQAIINYLKAHTLFPHDTELTVENLRDIKESVEGFVNQIYRIRGSNGHSVVMKQVLNLPISRESTGDDGQPDAHLADWSLDMGRMRNEIAVLIFWNQICPDICPDIYLFDEENGIIVMEDLTDLSLLRYEFTRLHQFPLLGQQLGHFFAHNLFYSSSLNMTDYRHQKLVRFFENPEYSALDRFIFHENAIVSFHRTMPNQTLSLRKALIADPHIQKEILRLEDLFLNHKECLIHTDLHASNIMINSHTTKIIDTEFAGFGPVSQDFGRLTASFVLNYFSWFGETGQNDNDEKRAYQEYLLKMIHDLYTTFANVFKQLCHKHIATNYNLHQFDVSAYLKNHLTDALSFTALNAASRIADRGLCHDLARLPVSERIYPQQLILTFCKTILTQERAIDQIDDFVDDLRQLSSFYPRHFF